MKRSSWCAAWTWLPLRRLLALGGLTCGLVLVLGTLWLTNRTLERDIVELESRVQSQKILQPLLCELTRTLDNSAASIGVASPLPTPNTLAQAVDSLQTIAAQTGIRDARFVPIAETVLDTTNSIQVEGSLSGSLEHFRRFALLLEQQPWLSGLERLEILSTDTMPIFTLSLRAVFFP